MGRRGSHPYQRMTREQKAERMTELLSRLECQRHSYNKAQREIRQIEREIEELEKVKCDDVPRVKD